MRLYACIWFLALAIAPLSALPSAETSSETGPGGDFVIGISPYLDRSVKDEVYRGIVRFALEDLPLNCNLFIYDAFNLRSITRLTLPSARVFKSPKTRANQFASSIGDLKRFLAQEHVRPKDARQNFASAIRLPQFCDFLSGNRPTTNSPISILLIGSPLYQDEKEPGFSMTDGYFPSDGHLQAARDKSIFGFLGDTNHEPAMIAHWVYFGDPWQSDLHQEKITRFWTLYLQRRGAQLATFCSDLPTALKSFRERDTGGVAAAKRWAIDPGQTKLEMLRIGRTVEVADWLTRDVLADKAPPPPSVMVGPMKIGIRWKYDIDLDLYAAPRRDGEVLYFQHTRSPEGYYYKDHRSSPGREYEFIEFETPVDIREVEAMVNFYKGFCSEGPSGEVRIEFGGRIYGGPFSISASKGNLGRSGTGQQDCWTRIPVQEILRIAPAVSAAR